MRPGMFYFFPRLGGVDLLREYRLDGMFPAPPYIEEISDGPEGFAGVAFHACPGGRLPQRAEIDWTPGMSGAFWLGWHRAYRPCAADLKRPIELSGFRVTLGDGDSWLVPLVCGADGSTGLPTVYVRGEHGQPTLRHDAKYDAVVDAVRPWAESVDTGVFPADDTIFDTAVSVLGVAYRVGPDEALALGLITQQSANAIIMAAADLPRRLSQRAAALGLDMAHAGAN